MDGSEARLDLYRLATLLGEIDRLMDPLAESDCTDYGVDPSLPPPLPPTGTAGGGGLGAGSQARSAQEWAQMGRNPVRRGRPPRPQPGSAQGFTQASKENGRTRTPGLSAFGRDPSARECGPTRVADADTEFPVPDRPAPDSTRHRHERSGTNVGPERSRASARSKQGPERSSGPKDEADATDLEGSPSPIPKRPSPQRLAAARATDGRVPSPDKVMADAAGSARQAVGNKTKLPDLDGNALAQRITKGRSLSDAKAAPDRGGDNEPTDSASAATGQRQPLPERGAGVMISPQAVPRNTVDLSSAPTERRGRLRPADEKAIAPPSPPIRIEHPSSREGAWQPAATAGRVAPPGQQAADPASIGRAAQRRQPLAFPGLQDRRPGPRRVAPIPPWLGDPGLPPVARGYVDIRVPPPDSAFIQGHAATGAGIGQASEQEAPQPEVADSTWHEAADGSDDWGWDEFEAIDREDDWFADVGDIDSDDRHRARILHRLRGRFLDRTLRRLT